MHCVSCGCEISEKSDFCAKCGKRIGAPKTAARAGFVVALLLVFFIGLGSVVLFLRADKARANMQSNDPNAPQLRLYTESIDTAFTIPQLRHKAYKFAIPAGVNSGTVQGHFSATGGSHNDIEVWLMNDDGFVNWQNKHSVTPIYNSGRVTQGTLNVSLPGAGTYYLVFNNQFSLISPKAVQDNLTLTYKR